MVCFLQPKHEDGARHEPAILCCHAPEPKPDQVRPPDSPISVLVFGHAVTQGSEREQGEVVGWPVSRCEALVAWRHRRRARWKILGLGSQAQSQRFPRATRPGLARWNEMQQAGRRLPNGISCVGRKRRGQFSRLLLCPARCELGTSAADMFLQWGESGFPRDHQDNFVLGGGEGCGSCFVSAARSACQTTLWGVAHSALDRARHARVLRRSLACREQCHQRQVYQNWPKYHRLRARYPRRRSSSHHVPHVFV